MRKALVHLREDLSSSLALRFAADHARRLGMILQVAHVVSPSRPITDANGRACRTGEKEREEAGLEEVKRLIRTENVTFESAGEPIIRVGDRDKEILDILSGGEYAFYVEGFVTGGDHSDFLEFIGAKRFRKCSGPVLIVKNIVSTKNLLLLLDDTVEGERIVTDLDRLYGAAREEVNLTVLYYRFRSETELLFRERKDAGNDPDRIDAHLAGLGWSEPEWLVVEGTPERTAEYMLGHCLVVTGMPRARHSLGHLLAQLSNPLLLFKQD
ncbi:MAG: hypothetical protein Kow0089_03040 [Desulfobulbaceae bacterium]